MKWWTGLSTARRVGFVTLVIALLGLTGSLVWQYPVWPILLVIAVVNVVNFIAHARRELHAPIPGRPELSKPEDPTP